jgi:hypothetical protein
MLVRSFNPYIIEEEIVIDDVYVAASDLPEISIDVTQEEVGEFYPFKNRLEFLISVAFEGEGQDCMSEPVQRLILKLLKDVGVRGVPSLSTIKSMN